MRPTFKEPGRPHRGVLVLVLAALVAAGCAGSSAYRGGQREAERGNWDLAVARFTRALQSSPRNIRYKIALENAKIQASRQHAEKAERLRQAGTLEKALEEFDIAAGLDPANQAAADDRELVRAAIRRRDEDQRRLAELANRRPVDSPMPVPLLSPRSQELITMSMSETLERVYTALGQMAGVNVVFDPDMRDRQNRIQVRLTGVTFQEALDQVGLIHRKGYRVVDRNTILVFDEANVQQRQRWDDQVIRTFYLENIEAKPFEAVLRAALGPAAGGTAVRISANESSNSITMIGTPDEIALADRFIRSNDKPKGEVLVEVEILEISRTKVKEYGLQLSTYQAGAELRPTGVEGEVVGGLTDLRAHLLKSLNASDWVVQIPSQLFTRFLQDDNTARIITAPKLRAFEGKPATLKVGTDVPIISSSVPAYGGTGTTGGFGGFGLTNANYKTVGVELKIDKVKVSTNNEISMEFMAEFSVLGEDKIFGTGVNQVNYPQFRTRKVENALRLKSGATAVIGGLLQGREARALKSALLLESIPILNKLLGGHRNEDEEIEILISLTPHILRAPNITEEDVAPMYLGLRNNLKVQGVRPLFGPDPEPSSSPEAGAPEGIAATPETAAAAPRPAPSPMPSAPPPPPASGGAFAQRAAFDRSEIAMKVGDVERVSINLFSVRQMQEVVATLVADGNAIEFVEIAGGALLSMDGAAIVVERQIEGSRIQGRFTRTQELPGGTGPVVTVAFRATRPGSASITVDSLRVGPGGGATPVPLAATVRVTVTQ